MILVGVALAVLAAALGTTSKQLIAASEHYHKDWLFHLGAGLNLFVGPVVDALAYMFAPSVIVAPLACLDVILNAVTAPKTLWWQGEKLTRAHVVGVLLVTLGAVATSLFACTPDREWTVHALEDQLFFRPTSLVYLGAEMLLILAALGSLKAKRLNSATRGLVLGGAAGLLMGNVFFAKGMLSIIKHTVATRQFGAWLRPTPYLLILGALGGPLCGHLFMKKGLAEYKGVFMVTIFEGVHISAACLSGCIVMEEMSGAPLEAVLKYWCGVFLIIGGLLAINTTANTARLRRAPSGMAAELDFKAIPRKFSSSGFGNGRSKTMSGSSMVLGAFAGLWHRSTHIKKAPSLEFCCPLSKSADKRKQRAATRHPYQRVPDIRPPTLFVPRPVGLGAPSGLRLRAAACPPCAGL